MKGFIIALLAVALSGCVSTPVPGSQAGWSILSISIQLGGTRNAIDTQNFLNGTNIMQRHSLPIDADQKADTSLSYPGAGAK